MKKIIGIFVMTLLIVNFLPNISSYSIDFDNENMLLEYHVVEKNKGEDGPKVVDTSGDTTFHGLFIGACENNQAQEVADSLDQYNGWDESRKTVLEEDNATKENITEQIEHLSDTAKKGDEVAIYIQAHGNNGPIGEQDSDKQREDGKKDQWEAEEDPEDDPDDYDNVIITGGDYWPISDDELAIMISGFENCTTITVIIDSCCSGTFTDGTADLDSAENGDINNPAKYGKDHLAVLTASKGTTQVPGQTDPQGKPYKTYTDGILEGLKKKGETTKADKNSDGITNSRELSVYAKKFIIQYYSGDNDGDGFVDEDNIDYSVDPQTGEILSLLIDNDNDGLIDEDLAPTFPNFWYTDKWYVDVNNTNGPWDGSQDHPFQHIQDGVDASSFGDCVYVSSGVYYENIVISKDGINLVGDAKKTHCNGGAHGNVVTVTGDMVSIKGFTFSNCGKSELDAAFDITSDYNIIGWNCIEDNGASGFYLHDSANYNYIHHNVIRDNDGAGLFVWQESKNNWIYHNDFINNGWYNVKDKEGGNIWNHLDLYGGNYWDDYTGMDTNSDGIGDTPYDILGDYNPTGVDEYPWVEPHGWNNPPAVPTIEGRSNGESGVEYDYDFKVAHEYFAPGSEPFTEPAVCHVDWGDGSEEWVGPFYLSSSGEIKVTIGHMWEEQGEYTLRARVLDGYGVESDWATFEVSMPKIKSFNIFNPWILRLLQRFPFLEILFD